VKVYKTIIDDNGDKWEAIPTTMHKSNFDLFKNGIKQDYGARKTTDIEPTIDFLKFRDKEVNDYDKLLGR
jgi:hypothetical protein